MNAVDGIVRFLFGDDIFISYSRADGTTYAAGLANELTKSGFACRFDQWGTEPGAIIPKSLRNALHRSAVLVLVASPAAAKSSHVALEVGEAKARRKVVLPIFFNVTPQEREEALWAQDVVGLPASLESAEALQTGDPAPGIVNRIEKTCSFWRKDKRLRVSSMAAAVVLVLLAIANIWTAGYLARSTTEARRQQEIARARRTAGDADGVRIESTRHTEFWYDPLEQSLLLAVEANRRLLARGIAPAEATESLRKTLSLFPRYVRSFAHSHKIRSATLTADGQYVVTQEDDGFIRVWDTAQGMQVSPDISDEGELSFDGDGRSLAIAASKRLSVRDLPRGTLLWTQMTSGRYAHIRFSQDGRYLAAVDLPSEEPEPRQSVHSRIVIWDARTGRSIAEIGFRGAAEDLALSPKGDFVALSAIARQTGRGLRGRDVITLRIWKLTDSRVQLLTQKATSTPVDKQDCSSEACELDTFIGLRFSPDSRFLAATHGYRAEVFSVIDAHQVTTISDVGRETGPGGEDYGPAMPGVVAFSDDGRSVGVKGTNGVLEARDIGTGKVMWHQDPPPDAESVRITGQYALLANPRDDELTLKDITTGLDIERFVHSGQFILADYVPDISRLVLIKGNILQLFDLGFGGENGHLSSPAGQLSMFNTAPGHQFAAIVNGSIVLLWKIDVGHEVARFRHAADVFAQVAISNDGRWTATVGMDKCAHVWDSSTGREILTLTDLPITRLDEHGVAQWNVHRLAISPKGTYLFLQVGSDSVDDRVSVWNIANRRLILTTDAGRSDSPDLFTDDEQFLVLNEFGSVREISLPSGQIVGSLALDEDEYYGYDFNARAGLVIRRIHDRVGISAVGSNHTEYFSSSGHYALSADGSLVASAAEVPAKTVRVIDSRTGESRGRLSIGREVENISFSPSGQSLAVTSAGSSEAHDLTIWNLKKGRGQSCTACLRGSVPSVRF